MRDVLISYQLIRMGMRVAGYMCRKNLLDTEVLIVVPIVLSPRFECSQPDRPFCVGKMACVSVNFFPVLLFPHTVRK